MREIFEQLPALVNGDQRLRQLGRRCNVEFMLECDDIPYHYRVENGQITELATGPSRMRPWMFAVRASGEVWREFWRQHPAPGYHDIFALPRFGHGRVEGDMRPLLSHLRFIKEVLAAPRRLGGAS